jgi:hypothetical protein
MGQMRRGKACRSGSTLDLYKPGGQFRKSPFSVGRIEAGVLKTFDEPIEQKCKPLSPFLGGCMGSREKPYHPISVLDTSSAILRGPPGSPSRSKTILLQLGLSSS